MKVPVPMIPAGGAGRAIAAFIAIALVVYMVKQVASVPPQNSNPKR